MTVNMRIFTLLQNLIYYQQCVAADRYRSPRHQNHQIVMSS